MPTCRRTGRLHFSVGAPVAWERPHQTLPTRAWQKKCPCTLEPCSLCSKFATSVGPITDVYQPALKPHGHSKPLAGMCRSHLSNGGAVHPQASPRRAKGGISSWKGRPAPARASQPGQTAGAGHSQLSRRPWARQWDTPARQRTASAAGPSSPGWPRAGQTGRPQGLSQAAKDSPVNANVNSIFSKENI